MIKKKLEYLMKVNKITSVTELANKTSIAKSVLHGYLQSTEPSLKNLVKLSEYFDVTTDYLLDRKSEVVIHSKSLLCKENETITITVIKNKNEDYHE